VSPWIYSEGIWLQVRGVQDEDDLGLSEASWERSDAKEGGLSKRGDRNVLQVKVLVAFHYSRGNLKGHVFKEWYYGGKGKGRHDFRGRNLGCLKVQNCMGITITSYGRTGKEIKKRATRPPSRGKWSRRSPIGRGKGQSFFFGGTRLRSVRPKSWARMGN